jgi:hypothetical protein
MVEGMSVFGFSGEGVTGRFEADPSEDDNGWDDPQPPPFWQSSGGDPRNINRGSTSRGSAREPPGPWSKDVRITDLPEGMRPGERSHRPHPGRMTAADAARAYFTSMGVGKKPAKARSQADDDSKPTASD